ncbi:MAG: substrate-binding domain-containing protein [Marinibacterium sp.]|nr:substrate-binding domain-containing protein [Marinibacterium sp.]
MTLKELSTLLGLSPTTVSRALNGYPEVREATRARVVEAARKHNYRPNMQAKRLATGRAMAIGHVIPATSRHEMVNPIFSDFLSGASEIYAEHGFSVNLTLARAGDQERTYRELHAQGAVDGIILHGPTMNDPRIAMLQDLGLPFVVHGRASGIDLDYAWLDVNNVRSFARATDLLVDLGHRRIALLNGLEQMDFAHRRRIGHEQALQRAGIACDPALMLSDEMTEDYGYRSALALLDRPDPPTAFLVAAIIPALGVQRALHDRGLRPGRDVSIICHDDDLSYLRNGGDLPIFTATTSSVREAGRRCAALLIEQINAPDSPKPQVLLEAALTIGQSTGPAPRRS